ncbi:peptidase M48 [candidate division KSB1 bacterium]|nr:MAG: peptidase M48 [candidate division KSB1 bacterium]MBC6947329.1 peptidase M48 [candidate division KSB1 bacterium]MCE7941440.1 peptidase M48 [Chlorobi bacterium CHB1]MDL1874480.1 peptidase M48 [Cytophagia bacterium CHB2]
MKSPSINSRPTEGGTPFVSRMRSALVQPLLLSALAIVVTMAGCARNLATGERHLNFTSENQEVAMGQQADQEISASLGLYADAALQKYVQQLGAKLSATSERPQLPWTFRVVDDPVVNAFALSGGFIYVTRGILAHLSNEAELAGVMGHEIGHVTAQHSVHHMATQQLTQLGLGIGTILKPELQRYAEIAGAGLGLLFLKYSRDDESQADELGIRYMTRTHHDPHQLSEVMTMLDRVGGGDEGRVPEWLATHPSSENRREHIAELIKTAQATNGSAVINRESYLRRLDGMVFGLNPREGFFKGTTFFQPDLKFRFDFPSGWKTANQKQTVLAVSPEQDAIIQITFSSKKSTAEAANEFFSQSGLTAQRAGSGSIHGLRTSSGSFTAQTEQGVLQGFAAFVEYHGRVYQLLGYTSQPRWRTYESGMTQAIKSFNRLTDSKMLSVQPQRLKIVTINRNMSLTEFNRQYPSGAALEVLALINQVESNGQLRSGQQVKRVVGEKFE